MHETFEKKQKLRRRTQICLTASLVAQLLVILTIIFGEGDVETEIGVLLLEFVVAAAFFATGTVDLARSKGYKSIGAPICFLWWPGTLIVTLLPDRYQIDTPALDDPLSNYPRTHN